MSKSMANNSFDTSISAFRAGGPWYRPKARAKVMASWSTSSTPASCSDSKSTARFWWRFSLVIWVAKNVTNQIQHRTVLPLWCLNGVTQYQAAWYGLPCEWTNFKFSYLWKWFWMCFLTLNFWSFFAIFFLARPHPPPTPAHTAKQWLSQPLQLHPVLCQALQAAPFNHISEILQSPAHRSHLLHQYRFILSGSMGWSNCSTSTPPRVLVQLSHRVGKLCRVGLHS